MCAKTKYSVAVRINNVKHGYPGELGFAFPPASAEMKAEMKQDVLADNHGGNTSASLVVRDETGRVQFHVLIDAGMGTVSSLAQEKDLWPKRVDLILITHGDIDHHSELPYMCEIPIRLKKRGLGELDHSLNACPQPDPIPIYAAQSGAKRLVKAYSFAMRCPDLAATAKDRNEIAAKEPKQGWIHRVESLENTAGSGRTPPVNEGPDEDHQFVITPIGGVGHRNCVIYVVEFGSTDEKRKIVFGWDMEYLPWKELEGTEAEDVVKLLSGADLMFVEMNTCLRRTTGHICYEEVKELVERTQPKECYVIHYSGFEDQFPGEKDLGVPTGDIRCLVQLDDWLAKQPSSYTRPVKAARPGWYPVGQWT